MGVLGEGGLAAGAGVRPLLWVALAGLLARGVMVTMAPSSDGLLRLEPSVIAANLNAGRGFVFEQYGAVYSAWKEPFYIVLLAGLTHWVGESDLAIRLVQGLFGVAAAVVAALIASHLMGDSVRATVAGIIAATNPFLVYYDTRFIHSLSLDAFLFTASIGTILVALSPGRLNARWALLAGVVTGFALWQRATLLMAGVASWAMAMIAGRGRERRRIAACAAIWLVVALLVITPWMVRNYLLFGRLVMTTDFAHILWLGNNPWSNGTYSDMTGQRVFYVADPEFRQRIEAVPEIRQYDAFLDATRHFISEHPETYARLTLGRLWGFFWFSPNAGVGYSAGENVLYRLAYAVLMGCGALGWVLYWRRADDRGRRRALILFAPVLGLAAVHALTVINLKHRVPFEIVLAVFAAEGVGQGAIRARAFLTRLRG